MKVILGARRSEHSSLEKPYLNQKKRRWLVRKNTFKILFIVGWRSTGKISELIILLHKKKKGSFILCWPTILGKSFMSSLFPWDYYFFFPIEASIPYESGHSISLHHRPTIDVYLNPKLNTMSFLRWNNYHILRINERHLYYLFIFI